MTAEDIETISSGIVDTVKRALSQAIPPLKAEITALKKEVAELKARPELKYLGVWTRGTKYAPGNALTHKGGLWICKGFVDTEPGVDFVFWQLAVKAGRDGRDAR